MEWWNNLPLYNMDKPCRRVLSAMYYQREQSFLTGSEIEFIYNNEYKNISFYGSKF